jgi:hypothetical protein
MAKIIQRRLGTNEPGIWYTIHGEHVGEVYETFVALTKVDMTADAMEALALKNAENVFERWAAARKMVL